jgi:hypothetical protein
MPVEAAIREEDRPACDVCNGYAPRMADYLMAAQPLFACMVRWDDKNKREFRAYLITALAHYQRVAAYHPDDRVSKLVEAAKMMIAWEKAEDEAGPFKDDNGAAFYRRAALCRDGFAALRAALTAWGGK